MFVRSRFSLPRRHTLASACLLALYGAAASAQTAPTEVVTVSERAVLPPASVAGFGDTPLARSPFQATTLSTALLADVGADSLGDITRLDASIGDAYNAPGYWASVRVRGYALDNRFNYRRDGLPISGETALLLGNKERIEVLKGTSGAQAGTSAPGGLVNLVVKRSRSNSTSLLLGLSDNGSLQLAADVDRRFGAEGQSGLRLNLTAERLDPPLRSAKGERHVLALAGDTRLTRDDLLEAELELSHQSQPSTPGFSLLGNTLPSAKDVDPRTNLNNQPWSQPVVFDGNTASLRWTHTLNAEWRAVAQAMTQHLRTDDRLAFPYGCSAEDHYDRYCSDGSFDLYDFRSEGERRQTDVLAARLEGALTTGPVSHQLSAGVLGSRYTARLGRQAYNGAGVGTVDGKTVTPAAPELTGENTNRTERSTELNLFDQMHLGDAGLWLGLRHTALSRNSVRTDGSSATAYTQLLNTPWIAGTWQFTPEDMAYLSWGQGIESDVTPNRPRYVNPGEALPAMKSRQVEVGIKHDGKHLGWSLTAFDIRQPKAVDVGTCDADLSCEHKIDGIARHRGLEAAADWHDGAWTLRSSAMLLHARREDSATAAINGLVPENVAQRSARLQLGYQPTLLPGLTVQGQLSYEGTRYVLPDNSLAIPGWTTAGLSTRYALRAAGRDWTLRAGVDNLFNRRAWQESPYQYGHVYLYPLTPRTFRASVQVSL